MLAEIFIATSTEAGQYATPTGHADPILRGRLTPLEYKAVTPVELGTLWAILEGVAWNVDRHGFHDESPIEEQDSWLFRFPGSFIDLLCNLDPSAAKQAAVKWAATEELACEPADVEPVIAELQRLARGAMSQGKSVYLWGCL